ncbi:hypothetical protein [Paenibacillus sp. FSL W8-0194]|uniref:hypothetical protein n=1 Tax=Paenibacillus sp. FSL W8-0194 TaxID=2921711 RepID=UPI0030D7CB0F
MKLTRWLVKTVLTVLLISGLTIMTTGLIVNSYVQSLLSSFNITLEGQSFGFGSMMKGLFGWSGGGGEDKKTDQEEAAKTPEQPDGKSSTDDNDAAAGETGGSDSGSGDSASGSQSSADSSGSTGMIGEGTDSSSSSDRSGSDAGGSGLAEGMANGGTSGEAGSSDSGESITNGATGGGESPTESGVSRSTGEGAAEQEKAPDNAFPVMGQDLPGDAGTGSASTQAEEQSGTDSLQKKRELTGSEKEQIFNMLITKLPPAELQKISGAMEDGLTEDESKAIEASISRYLNAEEYNALKPMLEP